MSAAIQIKGIDGGRDRRGLYTLGYNFLIEGVDELTALSVALPGLPSAIPEVDRKIKEWINNTSFMIQAQVEGIMSSPEESQDQYMVKGEKREEPIESFPDRAALEKDYGAYEDPITGRLKFPETMEGIVKARGRKASEEKNPLFGSTTYPVRYKCATRSYVRVTVPQSVWDGVDEVTDSIPAGFGVPGGSVWIKDEPLVRWRGNCWEIIENWKEMKKLKHLEALYLLLGKR